MAPRRSPRACLYITLLATLTAAIVIFGGGTASLIIRKGSQHHDLNVLPTEPGTSPSLRATALPVDALVLPTLRSTRRGSKPAVPLVVFTATFYSAPKGVRFDACIALLHSLASLSIPVVVIDASPAPTVRTAMAEISSRFVTVLKQRPGGKKGAALREGVAAAARVMGVTQQTWLCWMEAEKSGLAQSWRSVIAAADAQHGDVVVPMRELAAFQAYYPAEQFHSESFGNLYLDAAASERWRLSSALQPLPPLDWHFGPLAFRAKHSKFWTQCDGELWDAQLVPLVHAARAGLRVVSHIVSYKASVAMKHEEEGTERFAQKRLKQLAFLDPKVVAAWSSTA